MSGTGPVPGDGRTDEGPASGDTPPASPGTALASPSPDAPAPHADAPAPGPAPAPGSAPAPAPGSGSAPDPAQAGTSVSPTARGIWRGWRAALVVAAIVVAAALVGALLTGGDQGRSLDPADSTLTGSRALAELLRDAGVRVERVTDPAAAGALASDDSLLLVTGSVPLDSEELRQLEQLPGDRLLVGFDASWAWGDLAPGVRVEEQARPRSREPDCPLPAAAKAGSAYIGGSSFAAPAGAARCYLADDAPTLVSYRQGGRTITVTGSGEFMTNMRLAEDGNAALAMNLAGARPTLIWLVAPDVPEESPATAGPQGRSLEELIPAGVTWALVQLAVAVVVVALWRGRRLGPVVAERLPVVVRAAETVEGRGRLYRARRARGQAAAALRAAVLNRLIPRLGLPVDAGRDAVISAVAARTGQDAHGVAALLYGPPPADDPGLVALAAYLDTLERQVKDS
ncbi:membrane protein [Microtetraspora sp. NBRC 13810]|uniref:DUF4350 domain-containing protein n=1 Tax=Microtetraspora sp. NBRC 13810 TaxID=3030990 RepID=UPI0024A10AD1|nr:DUF4350 domain-containing protein [Microtetraspora sp. NBRC 13810]GLW05334.1 membrane protein [Microtetraspora sp. NBRC 13810]